MIQVIVGLLISSLVSLAQTTVSPIRIVCQTNNTLNSKLIQLRSDAGDSFRPTVMTIMDPQNKAFKEIVSHQIVYGDDNLTILFVAAVDSQNRFGVFKVDIRNTSKKNSSQFLNALSPKLKSFANYSKEFNFSLFSLLNGNLLYPSNENGQWRLLSLRNGSVVKEWNYTDLLFNPVLKDQMATWTLTAGEMSQLYTYNFKTDAREIINFKNQVQVLNINKEEIILVNYYVLETNKRVLRFQSHQKGSTKILYELDASAAIYSNFVSVGNNLIFTSEKTLVNGAQIQVAEAFLNVVDISKNIITQRIKYPPILVDLMRKQATTSLQLLYAPMFNQNEILFSLDEMGGIVKYQYKTN